MGLLSNLSLKAEMHRRETMRRFDDFFAAYVDRIASGSSAAAGEFSVSVVARSAESPVVAAIVRHAERLAAANCGIRAVLSSIEPAGDLSAFIDALGACNGQNGIQDSVRWAKRPALLDAHEQLVLGAGSCWIGDAMRRSPDVRFALDMFEAGDRGSVGLAAMGFDSLWSVSASVPRSRLRALPETRGTDPVIVQFEGMMRDGTLAQMPAASTRH